MTTSCASAAPVSTRTGPTSSAATSPTLSVRGAVVSHASCSPSRAHTAAWCSGSSDLKSRLSVMIGQSRRFAGCERALHDGADALEEVVAERWFLAGERRIVCDDGAAGRRRLADPREILLDREGHPGRERAFDAVTPLALFRIGVVRVQEDAAAWQIRRGSSAAVTVAIATSSARAAQRLALNDGHPDHSAACPPRNSATEFRLHTEVPAPQCAPGPYVAAPHQSEQKPCSCLWSICTAAYNAPTPHVQPARLGP